MNLKLFDYSLPPELIAQEPLPRRADSRMLVLNRRTGEISHSTFREFPQFLAAGDLVILNDTRVIPARLFFNKPTGARIEILLLRKIKGRIWEALVKPAKRVKPGMVLSAGKDSAEIKEKLAKSWLVELSSDDIPKESGIMPLPPYIKKTLPDPERYQTTFAKREGAVAAPTAGLHFTDEMFASLAAKKIDHDFITLHTGIGTFLPIRAETVEEHRMDYEEYSVSDETAEKINSRKGRLLAVGTTAARTLESAWKNGRIIPGDGKTDLYIYPGYQFKTVEALLTNFHLPRSTLLLLVSAFAGREPVFAAYEEAVRQKYRFYSFGDCMLIL